MWLMYDNSCYRLRLESVPKSDDGIAYATFSDRFDISFRYDCTAAPTSTSSLVRTSSAIGSTFTMDGTTLAIAIAAAESKSSKDVNFSKGVTIAILLGLVVSVSIVLIAIAIKVPRRRRMDRINSASYELIPPQYEDNRASRPRCITTGTSLPELPENLVVQRAELPGHTENS